MSDPEQLEEMQAKNRGMNGFRGEDLVCYCFGYTRNDIKADVMQNGRSLIMEKITAEKKSGGCECAVKNPKGR